MKVLAELLQNNIKTACFELSEYGIVLRMMDNKRIVLLDLVLDSNSFSLYRFTRTEKLCIGINLAHFHRMLKSIKKHDSVELFIDENEPSDLGIKIIPKENNRCTTSFIKIQNIQNLDIDLPTGYDRPIIVPSTEFQKMCKDLHHISNSTQISSKGFVIRFNSDAGGVMKRYTEFGENIDDDTDEKESYCEDFDTEQLLKITKNGIPLLFRTNIGNLGKISIYIKSKNLQEIESHGLENDEE
jgi:proliferating cell nuclear antigen PCNA